MKLPSDDFTTPKANSLEDELATLTNAALYEGIPGLAGESTSVGREVTEVNSGVTESDNTAHPSALVSDNLVNAADTNLLDLLWDDSSEDTGTATVYPLDLGVGLGLNTPIGETDSLVDLTPVDSSEIVSVSPRCQCSGCGYSGGDVGTSVGGSAGAGASLADVGDRGDAYGAGTSATAVAASGNQNTNALIAGNRWTSTTVTYSHTDDFANDYEDESGYENSASHAASFQALNATQQTALDQAAAFFSAVSGLDVTELTGANDRDATMRVAMSSNPPTAYGYYPASSVEGGDMWYNKVNYNSPVIGSFAYTTFLHEMGHALGLKHGHQTGGVSNVALTSDRDSLEFSLMTYRSYIGHDLNVYAYNTTEAFGAPQSLMMMDIQTLQYMYGADFATNSTDTVYTFSPTTGEMSINGVGQGAPGANRIFRTVWDGNGSDTYNLSNYTTNLSIDLTPGSWSDFHVGGNNQRAILRNGQGGITTYARAHVFNAFQYNSDARSLIENATGGSGADTIKGNTAANRLLGGEGLDSLDGGDGNDTLDGGDGPDTMSGGPGNDLYIVDYLDEVIIESVAGLAGGMDTVHSEGSHTLTTNVEDLVQIAFYANTQLYGNALNNSITGNLSNNWLVGYGGNDTLDAGAGNDYVYGGDGDDLITPGLGNDNVNGDNGTDTIIQTRDASMTLTNSQLTTTGTSGTGYNADPFFPINDNSTTNSLINFVSPGGVITDVDVYLSINHTWSADLDIFLISPSGTRVELSTDNGGGGDNYTNTIFDDDAATLVTVGSAPFTGRFRPEGDLNVLNGQNPAGTWTLEVSDDAAGDTGAIVDWAIIASTNGTETDVISNVEKAILTGGASANTLNASSFSGQTSLFGLGGNDTLTGGSSNDELFGDEGNDRLDGGPGADTMRGGTGDDEYYVSTPSDLVVEAPAAGLDLVQSQVTYTLPENVENLTLNGVADIDGNGNTLGNSIMGNAGNNTLQGYGSDDTLTGKEGDDSLDGGSGNRQRQTSTAAPGPIP
jgi:serralysin